MTCAASYIAFAGPRRLASGALADVVTAAHRLLQRRPDSQVLIFDERSSRQVDLDLRVTPTQLAAQLQAYARASNDAHSRGPGRPRLGVVAREITLLPRHWDWLKTQGSASATLRRLVEGAMRGNDLGARARQSSDAVYRFVHTMAGDRVGYEETLRAFYRGERAQFEKRTARWPKDIREHARSLAAMAWDDQAARR